MPAVAKKSAKVAASKSDDALKKPKKQSLKKIQKTAEILAAKKLAKLKSSKAISEKVSLLHRIYVKFFKKIYCN